MAVLLRRPAETTKVGKRRDVGGRGGGHLAVGKQRWRSSGGGGSVGATEDQWGERTQRRRHSYEHPDPEHFANLSLHHVRRLRHIRQVAR